jgi:chromosome segregation ATPase
MSASEYQELIAFLGQRFAAIDQRFAAIDQHFAAIDQRFAAIDQRLETMDRKIDAVRDDLAAFRAETLAHFDALYRRLERLEQEYQAILQGLRRIEAVLADEQGRREILERAVAALRENLAVLKARLDDVERRLGP